MTRRAAFNLERRVLEDKWPLFIGVTFDARQISADREPGLFGFKTAVRVVTIAAFHRAFHHLVTERLAKLRLDFAVAFKAQLRLARIEHLKGRSVGILFGNFTDQRNRIGFGVCVFGAMRRVAIGAADVVAPMLAAPKIAVFFPAGVTGETGFRDFFRVFMRERNDFSDVAVAFDMGFARPVT